MKKNRKQFKILISVAVMISIVVSVAIPVLANNNIVSEGLTAVREVLHMNPNVSVEVKEEPPIPQTLTQNIVTPPQSENPIDRIKAKSIENRKKRLHKQDEYNYLQKDIEKLLLSGVTLEDIYLSDQIGNELLVNPKDLIETQKKEGKTWDQVEKSVRTEKEKQLKALKLKHKNIESKFSKQTINTAEQLEILEYVDVNPVEASDSVIEAFRTEGRTGIQKFDAKRNHVKGDK